MKREITFKIDVEKKFKRLPHAPIVEAVIQWQATPTRTLEQTALLTELKNRFPDYECQAQHEHELEATFSGSPQGTEFHQRSKWDGFRLTSADKKHVCQFKLNTLVFSRLAPYEGWESFTQAASLFWQGFLELAAPNTVDRLGVRFISQINLKDGERVSDYVEQVPAPLERIGLASEAFLHQDTFRVPGFPFRLNLVRTIQPPEPALIQKSLIVDIDVSTIEATPLDSIEVRLQEMRFIKNSVFFTFMKDAEQKFS